MTKNGHKHHEVKIIDFPPHVATKYQTISTYTNGKMHNRQDITRSTR